MQRLYSLLFIFAIITAACEYKSPWNTYTAKGISTDKESYETLKYINDSTGYLAGDKMITWADDTRFFTACVLYKTSDQGKSWKSIPIKYKGSITELFAFNDTLIVLNQGIGTDTNYILQSANNGHNWEPLLKYTSDEYIRSIAFTSPYNGEIVIESKETKKHLWKKYVANSNIWETIAQVPANYYWQHLAEKRLFSFIPGEGANYNGIMVSEPGRPTKSYYFGKPYLLASATIANGHDLFIAVSDESACKVFKLTYRQLQQIPLGKYANMIPDDLYVSGEHIRLIAHQKADVGFLGVIHQLLLSDDGGKTWKLDELPDNMYTHPGYLFPSGFFITYCGSGMFQTRGN